MNVETLTTLLDVKQAEMDVKARELQELRDRISAMRDQASQLRAGLNGQSAPQTSVQDMQFASRFYSYQLERLARQAEAISAAETEEQTAEEALRLALGEKRGIEHLIEKNPPKRQKS